MDTVERLEACLNSPEGSATEDETERAIRSAIRYIKELRIALELVDDLGSFRELLKTEEKMDHHRTIYGG